MQTTQDSWKARKEMRVSAGGIQPIMACVIRFSNQFGQQIYDRYRHTQQPRTNHPEQILRQSGVTLNSLHQQHSVHLRPHLSLTVLNWQATARRSVNLATHCIAPLSSSPSQAMPISKMQPLMLWVNEMRLTLRRITQPEQFLEKVETRKKRVEQTITAKSIVPTIQSGQILSQQNFLIREAPLVVVKSLPKVIKQIMSESTRARSVVPNLDSELLMPPRAIQPKPLGQMGQPLPAVDVNRLTDQVVQAIDRRLIAHRERMGRI